MEKQYGEMTDDELRDAMKTWDDVAHYAAQECKAIGDIAERRGLDIENKWPIKVR